MEEWIIERVREGRPLKGTYPPDEKTLAEYRAWRETQPKYARALVAAGRKRQERLEMLLINYLVMPEARNAA